MKNAKTLLEVARELEALGHVKNVSLFTDGVVVADWEGKVEAVAGRASALTIGKWIWTDAGAYWSMREAGGWIMKRKDWKEVKAARAIAKSLTGEAGGWTYGSNSKRLINWALLPQDNRYSGERIMEGRKFGYHECAPGIYEDAIYFDMKHCYLQLIGRLPAYRFQFTSPERLASNGITNEEKAKWRDVMDAIGETESFRQSLWGTMLGSAGKQFWYNRGIKKDGKGYFGTHRIAALLVARMAHDLTAAASFENNAFYAQTDGIICPFESDPKIWRAAGMQFRIKGQGTADIQGQHRYSIPGEVKKHYREGAKDLVSEPRGAYPDMEYVSRFLC